MWKQCLRGFVPASLLLLGAVVPVAHAQCRPDLSHLKPMLWSPGRSGASLLQAGLQEGIPGGPVVFRPPIVGMWHVDFIAKTMNGAFIPDTVIDSAIVVWHEDKTEIMNSGRPPQDGNFCLGVWEEVGPRTYQLNHFAWAGNGYAPGTPDGVVGSPIGPVHYREFVTVGPEGKHYHGTFSLDQYNTDRKIAVSFTGVVKATRITVDTSVKDLY